MHSDGPVWREDDRRPSPQAPPRPRTSAQPVLQFTEEEERAAYRWTMRHRAPSGSPFSLRSGSSSRSISAEVSTGSPFSTRSRSASRRIRVEVGGTVGRGGPRHRRRSTSSRSTRRCTSWTREKRGRRHAGHGVQTGRTPKGSRGRHSLSTPSPPPAAERRAAGRKAQASKRSSTFAGWASTMAGAWGSSETASGTWWVHEELPLPPMAGGLHAERRQERTWGTTASSSSTTPRGYTTGKPRQRVWPHDVETRSAHGGGDR
jgi:hypothetical protein